MSKISPAGLHHLAALLIVLMVAIRPSAAAAADLPTPAAMPSSMNAPPVLIRIEEPHLSTAEKPVIVQYRGWPAEQVFDRWLGQAWRAPGAVVEFRALDGYVSHIPANRFERYRAYLVFERPGSPFSVDNRIQNEKNISLGPYYLVWDNLKDSELRAEGATYWPYQVTRISLAPARQDALLPAGMAARYGDAADAAQKYCLSCHQINGYGGDKWPTNLADRAKNLSRSAFLQWVLDPERAKPGTSMPGLPQTLPVDKRSALAGRLYDYLMAIPVER